MDALSLLYSMNGLIIGTAFLPQIVALLKDNSGAVSTSIWSWLIFTMVSSISLSYGLFKIHDPLFIFCSSISALGNVTILCLSIYRRWQAQPFKIQPHYHTMPSVLNPSNPD